MALLKFFKSKGPESVQSFFFLTHAKAGSTWIDDVLRTLFGKRVAPRFGADLANFRYEAGRIYSAAFMTREEFLGYPGLAQVPRFIVIRDLRDTLVSRYFSLRGTHPLDAAGQVASQRAALAQLSKSEGLAHIIHHGLARSARIQRSWIGHGEMLCRYEDITADPAARLREILRDRLALPIAEKELQSAIEQNSFEKKFGRQFGTEDSASHGRKGTPGDWRNHFDLRVATAFREAYGDIMVATGYEPDDSWAADFPA